MFRSIISSIFLILLFGVNFAHAHSGGLNKQGCHAGSKPYHCHRKQSEMSGNRLKCSNGSRSSECRPPAPPKPRPDKKQANMVRIPSAFNEGIGLFCKGKDRDPEIFLLSKTKRKYGSFSYRNDMVTINEYRTSLKPEVIKMSFYHLNRQTLELTFQGSLKLGKCDIVSPQYVVKIAIENLAAKLSKNKI